MCRYWILHWKQCSDWWWWFGDVTNVQIRSRFSCQSTDLLLHHFSLLANEWNLNVDTTPEGVLSSCGCSLILTLTTSQGYIIGCGCHEILIERCTTVLCLSNFSLYPIQLWFWCLSYSNHSFQLISIQYSVHHSDPAKKHQSCYQKPYISTSNWRKAHMRRHISCCNSNKAPELIASTLYKIHS